MSDKYWKTDVDIDISVKKLIEQYREDLVDNIPYILCIFKDKATISKGKIGIAKIRKVSIKDNVLYEHLSGGIVDFIIEIAHDIWERLDDVQKKAVMYHELEHIVIRMEDDGIKYSLRNHDVEEFASVIGEFGFYKKDLVDFFNEVDKSNAKTSIGRVKKSDSV